MTDIRNTGNTLKTRRWEAYEELVPTVGDSEAAEEYPFENGIQLFSAGLVIGYMNEDEDLLQEFVDDGEIPIGDDEDSLPKISLTSKICLKITKNMPTRSN
ncbi:MAG: hypothetical protein U5K37_11735 [Natrialbaceae archaeon]|nr:hypothetical protein [Natrialbaceae archaeon]